MVSVLVLAAILTSGTPQGAASTPALGAVAARSVAVTRATLFLGDVVDTSRLPGRLRRQAAGVALFRFSPNETTRTFTMIQLRRRIGVIAPALAGQLPIAADGSVTVSLARRRSHPTVASCVRLDAVLNAGDAPVASQMPPAPCPADVAAAPWRYDAAARVLRLARDSAAGEVFAAPPGALVAAVAERQPLILTATVGTVVIERRVAAIRAAGPGRPVFVAAETGPVFAAPPAAIGPAASAPARAEP